MKFKRYYAPDGRVLFVERVDAYHGTCCTVYKDQEGKNRRYLNRNVPACSSLEEAQGLLDTFAMMFNLKLVSE